MRLLYQRGAFSPHQTTVVAASLAAFSLGLTFNGTMLMLNRAYFSLQENWVPTLVAFGNLGVNAGLDAAFYRLGTWGIPLSTSVVNVAGSAALLLVLRRRLGSVEGRGLARSLAGVTVAAALAGAAAYAVWRPLDAAAGRSFGGQVASLVPALVAALLAYLVACRALRVREIGTLLSLRGRFRSA